MYPLRFITSAILLLAPVPAKATTWHILADGSGDAPTIQGGINMASPGDTVSVGPGTYNEQINFSGKDIVVKGELGPSMTILDGTGLGELYGVQMVSGETRAAVLTGMTVRGSKNGVGIFECEPSIIGNVITENGGQALSSGIICTGNGNPVLGPPCFETISSRTILPSGLVRALPPTRR